MKAPYLTPGTDALSRKWNEALAAAMAQGSDPATRLESALVVIDAHLNAIVHCPAAWGDVMSAEMIMCELLFLRAVILGAEPTRWGGEAFQRAKRRRFKSHNGPCSNWLAADAFDDLAPLLAVAVKAERKRMGVPSKIPARRTRRAKK